MLSVRGGSCMRGQLLALDRRIRWMPAALLVGPLLLSSARYIVAATTPAPILLVVNDAAPNTFGRYVGEILRAEGLNSFDILQVGSVTSGDLTAHKLVILAETPLTSDQVTLFANYATGGGRLLALRPAA